VTRPQRRDVSDSHGTRAQRKTTSGRRAVVLTGAVDSQATAATSWPQAICHAPVGRDEHSHPVQRIRRVGRVNAVQGHLTAHQEDEQREERPQDLLPERHLKSGSHPQQNSARDGTAGPHSSHAALTPASSDNTRMQVWRVRAAACNSPGGPFAPPRAGRTSTV
jgi:hypothetical protein